MKIESSLILMEGQSKSTTIHTKDESVKAWVGNERPDFEGRNNANGMSQAEVTLQITSEGLEALQAQKQAASVEAEDDSYLTLELSDKDKQKIMLIQTLLEKLTGKKIQFFYIDKIKLKKLQDSRGTMAARRPLKAGWGFEYDLKETYSESSRMTFDSKGTVTTTDGRKIKFDLELSMSREFASSQEISIRAGDAVLKDPLVINFNGTAPAFTDQKISFDIDRDGTADQISALAPGSGFLSMDLNGDGRINDGSELFGTISGNGFGDLSYYDSDSNNWIDENDNVYDKLRIWSVEPDGTHTLFALGEKGIGAIYLGNVSTAFDMKNAANELQGKIQRTGIFLREDGTAGTIQHIDVAV